MSELSRLEASFARVCVLAESDRELDRAVHCSKVDSMTALFARLQSRPAVVNDDLQYSHRKAHVILCAALRKTVLPLPFQHTASHLQQQ